MPILIPRMRTTVAVKAGVRRSARNAIRMSCLKRSIIDLLDPRRRARRSSFTRRLLLYKYLYEVVRNRVSKRRHFNHTMDSLRRRCGGGTAAATISARDDGRRHLAIADDAPPRSRPPPRLRRARPRAIGGGSLRRDVLRRVAADARDRHPRGVRRPRR